MALAGPNFTMNQRMDSPRRSRSVGDVPSSPNRSMCVKSPKLCSCRVAMNFLASSNEEISISCIVDRDLSTIAV